jgi:dTDP-6-deoxy-L-talose 4-dehydrogenase (NAD+)
MRVLVTGASGFVGAAVMRLLLEQGVETAALVSPGKPADLLRAFDGRFTRVEGRLADLPVLRPQLEAFKPDACIHLAWYAEPGKYLYAPENVPVMQQSLAFLQTLIDIGCQQFVGVGTCAEYDTDVGFLREDGPTKPATIYAACKLSMCLIGQYMAAASGVNFAWARLFYLFGEHEDTRRLVPGLIQSLRQQKSFDVTAGEQVRDYLHVSDVAAALVTLAEQKAQGIYNIASGTPITMRHLMETIGDIVGGKDLIRFGAIPYRQWEPMFICGDNHKLKALGWFPRYTLREGLEKVVISI